MKVAVAAIAAVLAVLALPAFLELRSGGTKMFGPQPMDFALLGLFSASALLFGDLAIFSIGLAVFPAGIVLLLFLYRALRRTPASWSRSRAALGGAAIGFGAPLLLIAVLVPATVECFPHGTGTSSGRWRGSAQFSTSTGSVSADAHTSTGRTESSDSVVTFRCQDGRLVEFQRTPR